MHEMFTIHFSSAVLTIKYIMIKLAYTNLHLLNFQQSDDKSDFTIM